MSSEVINLETIKKAKQLSDCIRLINNDNIHYLDLARKIEEKNLQKSIRIHNDKKTR